MNTQFKMLWHTYPTSSDLRLVRRFPLKICVGHPSNITFVMERVLVITQPGSKVNASWEGFLVPLRGSGCSENCHPTDVWCQWRCWPHAVLSISSNSTKLPLFWPYFCLPFSSHDKKISQWKLENQTKQLPVPQFYGFLIAWTVIALNTWPPCQYQVHSVLCLEHLELSSTYLAMLIVNESGPSLDSSLKVHLYSSTLLPCNHISVGFLRHTFCLLAIFS